MPSTALDSEIFGDLFGTAAMRDIFSDRALVQHYLDIEAALAKVQAQLELIPQKAADEIKAKANVDLIDWPAYTEGVKIAGFPILPLVKQLVALSEVGLGEYSHWGATTQDIMDTALILQLRQAFDLIEADLAAISDRLRALARQYQNTAQAGRSQLQQALPITFGYKVALWLSAVKRNQQRLTELRPRLLVGQFGGAVGTLASLGRQGLDVQAALCRELNLAQPDIAWHSVRDNLAEAVTFLGLLTGSLAKIGTDVLLMAQTEVGEVSEPYVLGRGTSSTMPQKQNPIASQTVIVAAKAVRQHVATMLDAMIQDHERASGPWMLEWLAVPEAFILTAGALHQTRFLLSDLGVNKTRMRQNLDLSNGLIVSEAVMMDLAPHLGRQKAHDVVHEAVQQSLAENRPLLDVLSTMPEVSGVLSDSRLAELLDPQNYTGLAVEMIERVLKT